MNLWGDRLEFSTYFPILMLWIVLFILWRNQRAIVTKKAMKKTRTENKEMIELAKRFIGRECLIYAFDSSHQFQGVIKEVSNGAILVENQGQMEAINLEFVIRIREFPTNKKGKKKSVVLD
jgi:hypothetical protein